MVLDSSSLMLHSAAILIGPVVAAIVFFGDSAVIVGLWPAHFVWTYCCVLKYGKLYSPHIYHVTFFSIKGIYYYQNDTNYTQSLH
jgi:hypothetical protein